jgi:gliding motility associated protien GldN
MEIIQDYNEDGYLIDKKTTAQLTDTRDMDRLWFWEEWFFDNQRSELGVRIMAMAPEGMREDKRIWPFWIPFNDYRPLFATYETFNPFNEAERRSFDDLFAKRRFSSFIVAETNNYDNRLIGDYLLGIDAIREGEKIQDKIHIFESDLWAY